MNLQLEFCYLRFVRKVINEVCNILYVTKELIKSLADGIMAQTVSSYLSMQAIINLNPIRLENLQ